MTTPVPALADLDGLPVLEVSLGHRDIVTAEHWLASVAPAPLLACTHLVRTPAPQVAWSLVFATAPQLELPPCAAPLGEGRAVVFPGSAALLGDLTVREILELSAIDRVEILGTGPADPALTVRTDDHVRPLWRGGELVLITMPAAGSTLVPFETRNPTPCCADHA
ncbi:hypothetical protein [Actinoplanes sp. N902-109]|uniref:hypothetical protein n=1 Tax=Actinoplanes sp. (strain N902-109) TaxID=649831 RepID=UPI00032936D0|nr:hypothetical protein [Actinoplanes sp. N902-109]AGL15113.1 hypothetical protein L083_1603 [Actinoplanes sp. N902-109]